MYYYHATYDEVIKALDAAPATVWKLTKQGFFDYKYGKYNLAQCREQYKYYLERQYQNRIDRYNRLSRIKGYCF